MNEDLYELLGLEKGAHESRIKAAYRTLCKAAHPDKGGDPEEFNRIQFAYDLLMNRDRRDRYDRTGRTDDVKVTPAVITKMVENTVAAMISAERPDGSTDDPTWENIRDKVIATIKGSRREIMANLRREEKKLVRLENLAKRFKSKTDADPVGDAFAAQRIRIKAEVHKFQDALELNHQMADLFDSYDYEVGPGREGQFSPSPTARLSGPRRSQASFV